MKIPAEQIATLAERVRAAACPDFLNRWINTPEQLAALEKNMAKIGPKEQALRDQREAKVSFNRYDETPLAKEMKEQRRLKALNRIDALKAKKSGETAAMPLSGKEALEKIYEKTPKASAPAKQEETAMAKKAKKAAKSKRKATTPKENAPNADGPREGSKLAVISALLARPEGCTTKEVLDATGWPAVSMPQQAKALGVTLKKEKDGSVTRYRIAA